MLRICKDGVPHGMHACPVSKVGGFSVLNQRPLVTGSLRKILCKVLDEPEVLPGAPRQELEVLAKLGGGGGGGASIGMNFFGAIIPCLFVWHCSSPSFKIKLCLTSSLRESMSAVATRPAMDPLG